MLIENYPGMSFETDINFLRNTTEYLSRVNTYSRDVTVIEKEIELLEEQLVRLKNTPYEKLVVCGRLYFLNSLKVIYFDESSIGDEDIEDVLDLFYDAFKGITALMEKYYSSASDKMSFIKPVLNIADDYEKLTAIAEGTFKMMYAYIKSEIDYLLLRYCDPEAGLVRLQG